MDAAVTARVFDLALSVIFLSAETAPETNSFYRSLETEGQVFMENFGHASLNWFSALPPGADHPLQKVLNKPSLTLQEFDQLKLLHPKSLSF